MHGLDRPMNRRLLLGGLGLGSLAAAMPAWAAGSVKLLPLPGGRMCGISRRPFRHARAR